MVKSFEDQLTYAKMARKFEPLDGEEMVATRDTFWIPQPMIATSYDGFDQTSNFDGFTELTVPVSVNVHKSIPKTVSSKNYRRKSVIRNYMDEAKMELSSQINSSLRDRVAYEGSVFTKRTVAATGFDDVALANAQFTETGVPLSERVYMAGVRSAIGMYSNLAARAENTTRSADAYSKAMINSNVAGFEVFQDDQPVTLAAAAGGATTLNGANQYWEPRATVVQADGTESNRDNRYSTITVTSANYAGIKRGDAFTIAGVNSVHMRTKKDTGQLQTFRVIGKPGTNQLLVAPAIISNGGNTIAGREYRNVTATPANGAALTWLNTTTGELNPYFVKGGLLLLPGTYEVDAGDGWTVIRGSTPTLGIGLTYVRQGEINDLSVKLRWDADYGTALLNTQMAGAEMFSQA